MGAQKKRRGDGGDRHSLKGVTAEESRVRGPIDAWPWHALELGTPDTSPCGQAAAPARSRGRQGKREEGESGWAGRWAGP
jgi:hypothetical protein